VNPVDFSKPQRQALSGIIIMFLDAARSVLAALWPIIVVSLLRSPSKAVLLYIGMFGLLGVAAAVIAWLRYRNFLFHIDETQGEFVLTEGIFNKTRTVIALDKIQQVHISQSVLQNLIGVHALSIDTAGSSTTEVKIKAISHPLALALKERLLDTDIIQSEAEAEAQTPQNPIISISPLSLLKVGLTSNYVRTLGILWAFLFSAGEQIRQAISYELIPDEFDESSLELALSGVLMVVGMIIILILGLNLGRIFFKYFGYQIVSQKGSLLLTYGLLATKNTILRPSRVQITAISRNYFQKKLGVTEMRVVQAGTDTNEHHEQKQRGLDIPGCSPTERDEILELLYGQVPTTGDEIRPHIRRLIISILFTIVLPLGGFIAAWTKWDIAEYAPYVMVLLVLIAIAQWVGFRNYRLFAGERFIIRQQGVWDVTRQIIEVDKIQSVSVSQRIWHKKLGIGILTLHTAGGDLRFSYAPIDELRRWADYWLYAIESKKSDWM
jgi:putative membrane protein